MSKLYDNYLRLKYVDKGKYYIFKVGVFYIFIDEDALIFSDLLGLKLTKLNDTINKCGFPISSEDKYFRLLDYLDAPYEVIENVADGNPIVHMIKKIDIDRITPGESYDLIKKFYGMVVDYE